MELLQNVTGYRLFAVLLVSLVITIQLLWQKSGEEGRPKHHVQMVCQYHVPAFHPSPPIREEQ